MTVPQVELWLKMAGEIESAKSGAPTKSGGREVPLEELAPAQIAFKGKTTDSDLVARMRAEMEKENGRRR